MDKCIHPSCTCKEYNEPKGAKGTLLQLKTGCVLCGHQASLHRKLTSIDRFIQDELKKSKNVSCQHLIPAREIPRSPLFEPYDLIPLPEEDQCTASNNEGGVQCTCKGFNSDIVRLWQKFRTHNLDHVRTELPKATCSFCRHSLSEHLARESTKPPLQTEHAQTASLTIYNYGQLKLKASSNITLPVARGNNSAALQLPTSINECKSMATIVLHKIGDSKELGLSLLTHYFRPIEPDTKTDTQLASPCKNGESLEPVSCNRINTHNDSAGKPATEGVVTKSGSVKKGTKRRKSSAENDSLVAPESKRRSSRIAEKKRKKDEEIEKVSKFDTLEGENWLKRKKKSGGKKLEALLEMRNRSEREIEEDTMTKPLTEDETKYLNGNAVEFVQSASKETNFKNCGRLPQAVSSDDYVIMATHPVEMRSKQEQEEDVSFSLSPTPPSSDKLSLTLVAVASEDYRDIYVAPLLLGNEQTSLVWTSLNSSSSVSVSVSRKTTSLSWTDTTDEVDCFTVFLAVGCSNGSLSVWKFKLQSHTSSTSPKFEDMFLLVSVEDTEDQLTACQWSPDKKTLAVGTISGVILFYSVDLEAATGKGVEHPLSAKNTVLRHMQTVHVCGSTVHCLAWSKDSRLLAVGGSDDYIQVLQSKEPKTSVPIARSSLLNYFERDDLETRHKFVHTHTLKGHQSFIADLCFLGNGHRLVSIGWDSQLLLWHRLLLPSLPKTKLSSSFFRTVHHNTVHKELSAITLPLTEVEPLEGFKVGPSASVDFLPLTISNFLDYGIFILVRNRLGVVYVVLYTRS